MSPRPDPPVGIERWDVKKDGPLSEKALRLRLESRGYTVTRYVYAPGTFFPEHDHDVDKIDAVLSGRFCITMGDKRVILEAGDSIAVPRGTPHGAEVLGDDPVVSLDATRSRAR